MWRTIFVRSCRKLSSFFPMHPTTSYGVVNRHAGIRVLERKHDIIYKYCRSMSKSPMAESRADENASATKESKNSEKVTDGSKKMTSRQKLSLVFAEYGVTAVVFHTAISLTSLGLCYVAVSSGLDVPGFLVKIGVSESTSQSIAAKGASTFVIAYACHKVFIPLRVFLTVTCTPLIVHRLRRAGLIK